MTTFDKLKEMANDTEESSHPLHSWWQRFFLFRCGWIWITKEENSNLSAWLASGKEHHQRMDGPCYLVEFDRDDKVMSVWESVLSMWPVRDENKAAPIIKLIREQADRAYALFKRKQVQ